MVFDDGLTVGDDNGMQCSKHPYLNNNSNSNSPGGICAFCLQDKLRKLLSDPLPSATTSFSLSSNPAADQNGRYDVYNNKNKNKDKAIVVSSICPSEMMMLKIKRTNSTTAPPSARYLPSLSNTNTQDYISHRRRGFWSFLHHKKPNVEIESSPANNNTTPFVSKSRSVGCGSRSFSGLGDSTLRRVESTREGKRSSSVSRAAVERLRCGGLFGGFNVTSSSSDWVSNTGSMTEEQRPDGRSKSWGWSPIRAFGKPSGRREIGNGSGTNNNSRAAPNLAAIPSLLAVSG